MLPNWSVHGELQFGRMGTFEGIIHPNTSSAQLHSPSPEEHKKQVETNNAVRVMYEFKHFDASKSHMTLHKPTLIGCKAVTRQTPSGVVMESQYDNGLKKQKHADCQATMGAMKHIDPIWVP